MSLNRFDLTSKCILLIKYANILNKINVLCLNGIFTYQKLASHSMACVGK